jgi:hypothetical protein
MAKNVFVLGLTDLQHDLIGYDRLVASDELRFADPLEQGRRELDAFDGSVDAVVAMLDLPPEVADVAGTDCLAEGIITGRQTAPEGSVAGGRFSVHGVFDVEFLRDEPTDSLKIIEVNTRISQSHSDLFATVDRVSNHQIDVEPGDRLADLAHQDTYNGGLGDVYVGADSREDLERRRQEILSSLRFELDRDAA